MTRRALPVIVAVFGAAALLADLPFNFTITPHYFDDAIYREGVSLFRLSSAEADFTLPATGHQVVVRRSAEGGRGVVVLRTGAPVEEALSEGDARALLADTRFLTMDAPEIRAAAARLRGAVDPIAAVERFVHDRIADKEPGIPLIPAREVLRLRRGDCTEHSVLATALLRSLGVPARALAGVYLAGDFMGKKNVFVYHMWVEAHHDGRWRLVDATRPGGRGANRYIAFAPHNLKTETPLAYLRAIGAIRGLSIRYCGGDRCD